MTEPTPHRAGGQTLAVVRRGRGSRVVVLHGGPGLDHRILDPLALGLAERHEVWTPDLPGHGASHREGERLPDLHAVVDRTARWFAALDGDPILVGHSLGAWIAREMLRRGRIRPRASVWIAPPAGSGPGRRSAVRARADAVAAADPGPDREAVLAEFLAYAAGDTPAPLSRSFVESARACRMRAPWTYGALLRQLHRALLRATPTCAARGPVLVVCGARDRTTPPAHAAAIAAATPGSECVVVPGEGHFPGAGGDDGIVRAVLAFLDRPDVRTPTDPAPP